MRLTNGLIPAFIKHNTGIISIVDYCVTHQVGTLFPMVALRIFFGIPGRHRLEQTNTIARLDIPFPRSYVHPTYEIPVAFDDHTIAEITQPRRDRHPDRRPLVAGALRIAFHLQYAIVEVDFSFFKFSLSKTGFGTDFINDVTINFQHRFNRIQIAIPPTPEMQIIETLCCGNYSALPRFKTSFRSRKFSNLFII